MVWAGKQDRQTGGQDRAGFKRRQSFVLRSKGQKAKPKYVEYRQGRADKAKRRIRARSGQPRTGRNNDG